MPIYYTFIYCIFVYLEPKASLAANEEMEVWNVESLLVQNLNHIRPAMFPAH